MCEGMLSVDNKAALCSVTCVWYVRWASASLCAAAVIFAWLEGHYDPWPFPLEWKEFQTNSVKNITCYFRIVISRVDVNENVKGSGKEHSSAGPAVFK